MNIHILRKYKLIPKTKYLAYPPTKPNPTYIEYNQTFELYPLKIGKTIKLKNK
jgi:hypothetical protein